VLSFVLVAVAASWWYQQHVSSRFLFRLLLFSWEHGGTTCDISLCLVIKTSLLRRQATASTTPAMSMVSALHTKWSISMDNCMLRLSNLRHSVESFQKCSKCTDLFARICRSCLCITDTPSLSW
jgi:hypothetical protein